MKNVDGYNVTVVGFGVVNTPNEITHEYIVVRWCEGKLWYYGQYDDEETAKMAAEECGNGIYARVEEMLEG